MFYAEHFGRRSLYEVMFEKIKGQARHVPVLSDPGRLDPANLQVRLNTERLGWSLFIWNSLSVTLLQYGSTNLLLL